MKQIEVIFNEQLFKGLEREGCVTACLLNILNNLITQMNSFQEQLEY